MGEDFFGNLFSSQFNTHRVLRHKLIRDGGSFRTEDEVFFSTDQEDFHPTDVQEDGDGSLLIVETGGWFIKGCPLSQVSKPELQGSIYRVRKKSAPAVEDPFGKLIDWNSISADQTAAYLQDPRPFVADRAGSKIVSKQGAINSLTNILKTSAEASARTRAVFALYSIGTSESIAVARLGLEDSTVDIRIAAARVAGLVKDQPAIIRLIQILKSDVPACRRQAATALGQIGEPSVVPDLLSSADGIQDRYTEHAITYSLILLNQPVLTQKGLDHPSTQVKRVALIALDQMDQTTLTAEKISPYLTSGDSLIQSTAVWVLSHHPEWADAMVNYVESRMRKPVLSSNDENQLGEILVSFGGNPVMQNYMASQLASSYPARKLFILETITACKVDEFPAAWTTAVGKELSSSTDLNVKMKALNLVRLHNLSSLTAPVQQIASDPTNPASLRISAIGALLKDSIQLSDEYFNFLTGQLHTEILAPVRMQAAAVLSQGMLSQKQMLQLAMDVLPRADAFILPRLLPVFRHGKDLAVGQALSTALQMAPTLDNFTEEFLRQTFEGYPKELNTSIEGLIAKLNLVRAERLNRIHEIEQNITMGDIERGRLLFFGKGICSTCHAIGKEGGLFGPDMTSIQRDRSAHDLIEAIVYPALSFVREYETYEIKTKDNTYRGIIHEQNSEFILLNISPQESVRIPIGEIVSTKIQELSMMPEGLDRILNKQELADLMAFLLGQDQDPETDSKLLR
jgi:putative heme-binding domain-containing protein